MTSDVT